MFILDNYFTINKIRNCNNKCYIAPVLGAALVSGAASLGSSLLGAGASSNLNGRNRRWQENQATIQFNRQKQLIDEANAYNDPSAVRKRLEDAGFNPSLVFGGEGNIQASPGTASMANNPTQFDVGAQLSSSMNNLINNIANVINLKNAVKKNDADVRNVEEDTRSKILDNQAKAVQNAAQQSFIDKQLESLGLHNTYQKYLNETAYSDSIIRADQSSWSQSYYYNQARQMSELANLTEQQAKIAKVDASWRDKANAQDILLKSAQIAQAYQNIKLMRDQGMVYQADIALKGVQKKAQKLENDWNSFKSSGASKNVKNLLFQLEIDQKIADQSKGMGIQDIPGMLHRYFKGKQSMELVPQLKDK